MKRKPLDAFSWFLIGCTLVIALAIIGDAFKRAISDLVVPPTPVAQPTSENAATARISRPKLVI